MLQLGSLLELVSSCWFSRWSGCGVRWTRFLLIVLVGVSTSYDQIVAAASITFSERWRSFTKTFVPGPIGGKSIALCLLFNTVCYLCLLMLSLPRSFSGSGHCRLSWKYGTLEHCSLSPFPSATGQERTCMQVALICRPIILYLGLFLSRTDFSWF